jgi:hypothetical protein
MIQTRGTQQRDRKHFEELHGVHAGHGEKMTLNDA